MQRFLILIKNGQVVQVMHLNGKKKMIPLKVSDTVRVRGEYVWTETGGTIHNTDRELSLDRRHGWVEHDGKKWQ